MKHSFPFFLSIAAAAFAGAWLNEIRHEIVVEKVAFAKTTTEAPLLSRSSESFRAVARAVGPSVVVIKTTSPQRRGPRRGDPFQQFFRQFGVPFDSGSGESARPRGLGSGFVIDKKGYIVTNHHVVKGAGKVFVNLPSADNVDLPAKIVGMDPRSDLAVIKIEPRGDLSVAQWADSEAVEVGDWAIAIGSPFMLSHTVTAGIVSAKGRNSSSVMGSDFAYEMLQTDAAINPGNSGGPLCTMEGKVMGVNTAIFSESGGYMGIGFAIPSNLARSITASLSKGEKIVRGYLGVIIQPIDESMEQELRIKHGALVHQVQPKSPAAKAGIKPGDVVLEANGKPVSDPTELQQIVGGLRPGEKIKLQVVNFDSKKKRHVEATIGQLPESAREERE